MSELGLQRLATLAAYLRESVPDSQFDMNVWVGDDWQGDPDLSCGTSACALGWATTIPSFREAGLTLVRDRDYHHGGHVELHTPEVIRTNSIEAASEFFDISESQADHLFGGYGTSSRTRVAASIDWLVSVIRDQAVEV